MYEDHPSAGRRSLTVVAASPHDTVGPELADELERLGLRVALVADVAPYVGQMSACIVVLRPHTANSGAVRAIFDARPPRLLPVLAAPMALPTGPWTSPPITLAHGIQLAAEEIAAELRGMRGPASRPAPPARPAYPSTPPSSSAPAYPPASAYPPAPAYPTTPGAGYYGPPFTAAPPRSAALPRRSHAAAWILGSTAVAVVLLLAAIGGALALRRASTPLVAHQTPTVPANFSTYTDTNGLFRLSVPNGWSTKTLDKITEFISTSAEGVFEVTSVNIAMSADEISVNEEEFFKSADAAAGGNGTYTNLQGPTSVTVAGAAWTREAADLVGKGGMLHAVVLVANHGGNAFLVAYAAASTAFASTDASAFQPMLNSFRFLK